MAVRVHADSLGARRDRPDDGKLLNKHDPQFVRFDRKSVRPLHRLPSHEGRRRGPVSSPLIPLFGRRRRRLLPLIAVASAALVLALAGMVAIGLFAGPAQRIAEDTLRSMVPETLNLELGGTDVRLAFPPSLAIRFDDAVLTAADGEAPVASADRLSVRLDPASLFAAEPRVAGIALDGALIDMPTLRAATGAGDDPVAVTLTDVPARFDAMFAGLRRWAGTHLHHDGGLTLSVTDSAVMVGANPLAGRLGIVSLTARADGTGTAQIAGALAFDDTVSSVSGILSVPEPTDAAGLARLVVEADAMPFPWRRLPTLFSNVLEDHEPDAVRAPVATRTRLVLVDAAEGPVGDSLRLSLTPRDLSLKLAEDDFVPVSGMLTFDYGFDDQVVTLEPAVWSIGRSTLELGARLRDAARNEALADLPAGSIEFDAIANRGRLAPADSPVGRLSFAARARGVFEPGGRLLRFTDMQMESDAGGARAEGQMSFDEQAPSAVFRVDVEDMTIAGLKQFWPAPVARAARRWVLENLAGGRVVEGHFDIVEPLRRRVPQTGERIRGDSRIVLDVEGVRFDIAGDLPPVRDAAGRVEFADEATRMTLEEGTVYLPSGRIAAASEGMMIIRPEQDDELVMADANVRLNGSAAALGEIIAYRPINAQSFRDYDPADLSGEVDARVALTLPLNGGADAPAPDWSVEMTLDDAGIAEPIEGRRVSELDGAVSVSPAGAELDLSGSIDAMPAEIAMTIPFAGSTLEPARQITLRLDDESRRTLAPGLNALLRGPTPVRLEGAGPAFDVEADLTPAQLVLPWIGWSKGAGVGATAAFDLVLENGQARLDDFRLTGGPFAASGSIAVAEDGLERARFASLRLNEGDDVAVDVRRQGDGYSVDVTGSALDVRALIRHVRKQMQASAEAAEGGVPVTVSAAIGTVRGFGGETLRDVRAQASIGAGGLRSLSITGSGASGMPFSVAVEGQGAARRVRIEAFDAGEMLRFADLYGQVRGGVLTVALSGGEGGRLSGPIQMTDFRVFDEPRLAQLVSSRPEGSDSLRDAVGRDIDTREVVFDLAQGSASFTPNGLSLDDGIVRGPLVGFALQGQVFDPEGQMRMTGTFMPAYGLNSLFADIPLLGLVLGNGRDRGLIGVTFKLEGSFERPQITVNPLSLIAPGVFRGVFEFR